MEHIEVRPGEKKHETLLTKEEGNGYFVYNDTSYDLSPTTSTRLPRRADPYTSDISIIQLTREELMALLED
jgi:DNA-binding transcriptional regulator YhcF (GntR family)